MQKDAEASLPPLVQGDPLILQMDDMVLPVTWKFKYRYMLLDSLIISLKCQFATSYAEVITYFLTKAEKLKALYKLICVLKFGAHE